jgi:hypothetical protein
MGNLEGVGCKVLHNRAFPHTVLYIRKPLRVYDKIFADFPSLYMSLHLIPSEFPYTGGQFPPFFFISVVKTSLKQLKAAAGLYIYSTLSCDQIQPSDLVEGYEGFTGRESYLSGTLIQVQGPACLVHLSRWGVLPNSHTQVGGPTISSSVPRYGDQQAHL